MIADEALLLEVLNSAPRRGEAIAEELTGADGATIARRLGGTGAEQEVRLLRRTRDAIQALVRGHDEATTALQELMDSTILTPDVTPAGIRWGLDAPADMVPAARIAQAWSTVSEARPGRLKACANEECNLFLIDRTRPGTAKWCSMAVCGNRMKARAHASRARAAAPQ
ncbi:CGNR zinc finger domain-containing protein [Tomitella gaofuii]|uniref:CGNR zinc finger domain-containing protein n=1 Tax=Tomitella gaofuii TaxID=2760083 RepID=UPI0015F8F716|nr:CGNR zinc finger domain-containing protein [Tomitella gaofuii]